LRNVQLSFTTQLVLEIVTKMLEKTRDYFPFSFSLVIPLTTPENSKQSQSFLSIFVTISNTNCVVKPTCGLYYKHITIVMTIVKVTSQFGASL